MSVAPWMDEGSPNYNILNGVVGNQGTQSTKNPSYVPSMADMAAERLNSQQQQQRQVVQDTPNMDAEFMKALLSQIRYIGDSISNTHDKKVLSQGTVFLVCIDRTAVSDVDSSTIPSHLVVSPNTDIKIVSYQEFDSQETLKPIVSQYQTLINEYNQANGNSRSRYYIFLGRLIEEVNFNALDYKL